jgi:hypothetical protein
MPKNHVIVVRVTRSQKDTIQENADAKGFSSISDFVRDIALKNESILERKIGAIYDRLFEVRPNGTGYTPLDGYTGYDLSGSY